MEERRSILCFLMNEVCSACCWLCDIAANPSHGIHSRHSSWPPPKWHLAPDCGGWHFFAKEPGNTRIRMHSSAVLKSVEPPADGASMHSSCCSNAVVIFVRDRTSCTHLKMAGAYIIFLLYCYILAGLDPSEIVVGYCELGLCWLKGQRTSRGRKAPLYFFILVAEVGKSLVLFVEVSLRTGSFWERRCEEHEKDIGGVSSRRRDMPIASRPLTS